MLLEFRAKNYKSFKDELVFSMIPAPKQTGLDYSILKKIINKTTFKALSSAVIYGANASGKTNIIGAMDTLKQIILRGNIKNSEIISPNAAAYRMELIPCCSEKKVNPVEFSIKFIDNNILFHYILSIEIGDFLDKDYKRNIISELLFINGEEVFSRNLNSLVNVYNSEKISNLFKNDLNKDFESAKKIANNSLNNQELFLTNGFKNIFSAELVKIILEWLEKKFIVVYQANNIYINKATEKQGFYIDKELNEAAKIFGINSNAVTYFKLKNEDNDVHLYSMFKNRAIPAEMFESFGTIRFMNEFPLIIDAIKNGFTLVIDEFDASIHPMAVMSIINLFHNDNINKNKAQLIFNTHNPIFLNKNLYRRDEIKFVERNDETHLSIHYSLSDFGTSGDNAVRKGNDYMKHYFIGQYGAIKDVDFSTIFDTSAEEKDGV